MQQPPISAQEIEARISNHLDELLSLWWAEQGVSKPRDLDLIASVLPYAHDKALHVLDLCCGPGDAGRAIQKQFPNASIDGVDREAFLASICASVNRREKIAGKIVIADLAHDDWRRELAATYDVIAVVNALHWFDPARLSQIVADVFALLRKGGTFVLAEPVDAAPRFAAGFAEWKARQPPRYTQENWQRFWGRATQMLGYDPVKLWGPRPPERVDDDVTVDGWLNVLRLAGFANPDVLVRDADQVIIAAIKG